MNLLINCYLGPLLFTFISGVFIGRFLGMRDDGRACVAQSFIPIWNIILLIGIIISAAPYLWGRLVLGGEKLLYWIIPD